MNNSQPAQAIICPACQHSDLDQLEFIELKKQHELYAPDNYAAQQTLTDLAVLSAEQYTMQKCKSCGLEFANPLKSPSSQWYEEAYRLLDLYPEDRWEFDYVTKQLGELESIGEIGCGSGSFLEHCKRNNLNCHGLDFSSSAVSACKEKDLSADLINITNVDSDKFLNRNDRSVIFSAHVLEHLDNPSQLFELARKWSKNDATLWISIPSDKRPSRYFGEVDFLDQPPHHITRWNSKALESIGSNYGWKLQEVIYEPIDFKAKLWCCTTSSAIYRKVSKNLEARDVWLERTLRYFIYPFVLLQNMAVPTKLTGFSLLAKYSKVH